MDADSALLRTELDTVMKKNAELLQQLDAQEMKTAEAEQQGHHDAQLIRNMREEASRLQRQLTAAASKAVDEPATAAQYAQRQQQQIDTVVQEGHACDDRVMVSVKLQRTLAVVIVKSWLCQRKVTLQGMHSVG